MGYKWKGGVKISKMSGRNLKNELRHVWKAPNTFMSSKIICPNLCLRTSSDCMLTYFKNYNYTSLKILT